MSNQIKHAPRELLHAVNHRAIPALNDIRRASQCDDNPVAAGRALERIEALANEARSALLAASQGLKPDPEAG